MPDFIAIDEISNNIDLQTNNIINVINSMDIYYNYGLFSTGIECNRIIFSGTVSRTISSAYYNSYYTYIYDNRMPSGIYEFKTNNRSNIQDGDMLVVSQGTRNGTNENITWSNYFFHPLTTSILIPIYHNYCYEFGFISNNDTTERDISYDYYLLGNFQFCNNSFPYIAPSCISSILITNAYGWTNFIITEVGWTKYYINCTVNSTANLIFKQNEQILYQMNSTAGNDIIANFGVFTSEQNINDGQCKISIYIPASGTNKANINIYGEPIKFNNWGE